MHTKVIAFWEEYLEHDTLPNYKDAHVVLLRPSMSYMLLQTKDPMPLKEVLPSFKGVSHIFLPINDNTNSEMAEGGSHWSLVVVSVNDGIAFHYDSLHSMNDMEAYNVTEKLSKLLGAPLVYKDLTDTPQQANSSDCGVFVCFIMKHLLVHRLLTAPKSEMVTMSMGGRVINAAKHRKEIMGIIEEQRREGERRRSTFVCHKRIATVLMIRRSSSPFAHSHSDSKSRSPPRIN